VFDCGGLTVAPGYIDIQLNGGWGVDFSSAPGDVKKVKFDEAEKVDGIDGVTKKLLCHGCTAIVATVISCAPEQYRASLPHLRNYMKDQRRLQAEVPRAWVLGLHLEGPFIKIPGAHPLQHLWKPEKEIRLSSIEETYGDLDDVKLVTLAPELKGAQNVIPELQKKNIVVAAGHSEANLEPSLAAVNKGVTLITHLFNAMHPFHHRDPGLIGVLGSPTPHRVYYSIISDGLHVHPASLKMAYRCHPRGAVLITDSSMAMGLQDGDYHMGDIWVKIKAKRATVGDSETLAGSIATMDECVRLFRKFTSCSTVEAVECATRHPAEVLGISHQKGTLSFGADADLILLDDELNVRGVIIDGRIAINNKNALTEVSQ